MPGNLHLKIDSIPGESRKDGHENQIELESVSWDLMQAATAHTAHGSGAGRVKAGDFTFTKFVDKSDSGLAKSCATGDHIDEATIYCEKAGGEKSVEYLKFVLKQVFVTSYGCTAHSEGEVAMSHGSLSYAEYQMTCTPQEAEGTAGAQAEHSFSVAQNKVV
jgi:type VI secretion system secreted protein Hcp